MGGSESEMAEQSLELHNLESYTNRKFFEMSETLVHVIIAWSIKNMELLFFFNGLGDKIFMYLKYTVNYLLYCHL